MAVSLILTPETEQDLAEAYAWYELRRVGLGEEFLGSVDACLRQICRSPLLGPIVDREFRRSLVRRFPYAVFYEYCGDALTVYAVLHTARDPGKWRLRLP